LEHCPSCFVIKNRVATPLHHFLLNAPRFSTKESATHAIVAVHNTDINGQPVKCSWGKESGDPNNTQAAGQVSGPLVVICPLIALFWNAPPGLCKMVAAYKLTHPAAPTQKNATFSRRNWLICSRLSFLWSGLFYFATFSGYSKNKSGLSSLVVFQIFRKIANYLIVFSRTQVYTFDF